jgi:hypothetical protein
MAINCVAFLTGHLYQITYIKSHSQAVSIQQKKKNCSRAKKFCDVYVTCKLEVLRVLVLRCKSSWTIMVNRNERSWCLNVHGIT